MADYFQFQPPPSNYGSISQLMLMSAAQRAQAIREAAAIQAQQEDRQAQMVSNLGNTIGGIVSGLPGQLAKEREQAQIAQQRSQQMALTQNTLDQQARQRQAESLISQNAQPGPDQSYQPAGPNIDPNAPGQVVTQKPDSELPQKPGLFQKEGDISVWDTAAVSKLLTANGIPLSAAGPAMKVLEDMNNGHRAEAKARQEYQTKQTQNIGLGAVSMLQMMQQFPNVHPSDLYKMISQQYLANGVPQEKIDAMGNDLFSDPSQTMTKLQAMARLAPPNIQKKKDTEEILDMNQRNPDGTPKVIAPATHTTTPTEASIAWELGNPDPAIRARAQQAMAALKPSQIKPGTIEDWVSQSRALAATKKGSPLLPEETFATDAAAIRTFKELSKDPELAKIALSNDLLRNQMLQMQLGQQPTREEAATFAKQLIDHKIAPSQISLFGGLGTAGAAFKRMVGAEAIKIDPNFDWEQAESDSHFSKSPHFQSQIRFMDSVANSIPQLIKNAQALGNTDLRFVNTLVNLTKNELNNPQLRRVQVDALELADGVAKVLQGGSQGSGTTDAKLAQAAQLIKMSDSIPTMIAAAQEIGELFKYRRTALTRGTYLEQKQPATTTAPPSGGFSNGFSGQPLGSGKQ